MTARNDAAQRFDEALAGLQKAAAELIALNIPPEPLWGIALSRLIAAAPLLGYVGIRTLRVRARPMQWLNVSATDLAQKS